MFVRNAFAAAIQLHQMVSVECVLMGVFAVTRGHNDGFRVIMPNKFAFFDKISGRFADVLRHKDVSAIAI